MPKTQGIYLTYSRLLDRKKADEWDTWYDNIHLPDIVGSGSAWRATRWQRQDPGHFGWTHTNIYEVEGPDIVSNQKKAAGLAPKWRAEGRHFLEYALMDLKFFRPVGRWANLDAPSSTVQARVYVLSLCGDRSREDEWNQWYDEVHVPDILDVDGFVSATRWELVNPTPYGANYLALYDVDIEPEVAQTNLNSAVPAMYKKGRMHPQVAMADMVWLIPTGRWSGLGYTHGKEMEPGA